MREVVGCSEGCTCRSVVEVCMRWKWQMEELLAFGKQKEGPLKHSGQIRSRYHCRGGAGSHKLMNSWDMHKFKFVLQAAQASGWAAVGGVRTDHLQPGGPRILTVTAIGGIPPLFPFAQLDETLFRILPN